MPVMNKKSQKPHSAEKTAAKKHQQPREHQSPHRLRAVLKEARAVVRHPMYRVLRVIDEKGQGVVQNSSSDQKGDDATICLLQKMLAGARDVIRSFGLKPIPFTLTVVGSWIGSTATAFNTALAVQPDTTGEFSTMSALFDECIVDGVTMDFAVMRSASSGVDSLISLGSMAYDPVDAGTYSAVQTVAEASQHIVFQMPQVSATVQVADAVSRHGLQRFHFKIPEGPQGASPTGDIFTGLWSSTAQAAVKYGFIKPYLEAGGSGASWTIRYVLYYHMRFRSRT